MGRALINVPAKAKKGEIIEIKALVSHPMETGYRHDVSNAVIPRDIINRFRCLYDGEVVFEVELSPAIAANPYFAFTTIATGSGTLSFVWLDDVGVSQIETRKIEVV